jgi:dienelactone hydrolase
VAALVAGPLEAEVERITFRGDGGEPVEAIHARPDGLPRLGLVLHPDVLGIRPLFDDLCRRLATHGLAVIAPEPYNHVADHEHLDAGERMARAKDLEDATQLGYLERAADWLVVNDDVAEVAILGFCMGGMYALKAAGGGRFDRAVAFYGMVRVALRARRSRSSAPRTTGHPRRTSRRCASSGRTAPSARSSSTRVPTTGSSTTRPGRPTGRTTRRTRGAGSCGFWGSPTIRRRPSRTTPCSRGSPL